MMQISKGKVQLMFSSPGQVTGAIGYQYTFLVAGPIGLLGIPLLYPIFGPVSVDLKDLDLVEEQQNLPSEVKVEEEKQSNDGHVKTNSSRLDSDSESTSEYDFSESAPED